MEIAVAKDRQPVLVTLRGDLTSEESSSLERALAPLVGEAGNRVLVDLAQVRRIDSRGLGTLVSLACRANMNKSRIAFARPNDFVGELIAITRLDTFLVVASDLDAASASIGE